MKKIFVLLFLAVSFQTAFAQQPGLPQIPRKVNFAGITVNLDTDAQNLVQKEVSSLLVPENRYVQDKLQRIQWYFPVIERILSQENVPDDFKYLAVVESSLLPDAVSSSNAVGFWQMKAPTAQELGLRVDNNIDERKNIYASTKAAARYLKRSNQIYKNWISALYSYLLGAGGISKIVPADWANATQVTFTGRTDRYLIKTISARIAFEYRISRMKQNEWAFFEYTKGKGKTLAEIAYIFEIDLIELKRHNSWLQVSTIPDDYSVALFVPANRMDLVQIKAIGQSTLTAAGTSPSQAAVKETGSAKEFVNRMGYPVLVRVTKKTNKEEEPVFYEINEKKGILAKPGDNVASLAKAGKLKVKDFLLFNDMTDADVVNTGQVYYLQRKYSKGPVAEFEAGSGESMWDISQAFGVKLKTLLKLNRMKAPGGIVEGQVVYLQNKRPKKLPLRVRKDIDQPEKTQQKLPVLEKFDEPAIQKQEVMAKTDDTFKKTPEPEQVSPQLPSETVVIERPPKRSTQPQSRLASNTTTAEEKTTLVDDNSNVVKEAETKNTITPSTSVSRPVSNPNVSIISEPVPEKEAARSAKVSAAPKKVYHKVAPGQNLYSIARKYDVTVRELADWNNFTIKEKVRSGQRLIVGYKADSENSIKETAPNNSTPKTNNTKAEKSKSVMATTHKVVKGETLFSISRKYDVTMKQIQEWNNMRDRNVKIGQKLVIKKI